jgi:hypothetical protein
VARQSARFRLNVVKTGIAQTRDLRGAQHSERKHTARVVGAMNRITLFIVIAMMGIGALVASMRNLSVAVVCWVIAAVISQSVKMANALGKFVVLRAGKLQGVRNPGVAHE